MNIIRKLKFNNIHPVEFTEDESKIIEIAEKTILSLHGGTPPYYYREVYHNYIYYSNSVDGIVMYKEKDGNYIHISKPFLHTLSNSIKCSNNLVDYKKIDAIAEILTFYFKKHLIKKITTTNYYAVNHLDDLMKKGWWISVML